MPISLRTLGYVVSIDAAGREQTLDTMVLGSAIPDLKITQLGKIKPGAWQICFNGTKEADTVYARSRIEVCGADVSDWDFARLAAQIMTRQLSEDNLLLLHASAVYYAGRGILFIGGSEAGKTQAAVGLCTNGAEFISGEHTVVDLSSGRILAGTKVVNCKPQVLQARFGLQVPNLFDSKDYFTVRDSALLDLIVCIKALPVGSPPYTYELSEFKKRMLLYQNVSELLKGNFLTHGQTRPAKSLDTDELASRRAKAIASIVSGVPIKAIESNPADLPRIINDTHENRDV